MQIVMECLLSTLENEKKKRNELQKDVMATT